MGYVVSIYDEKVKLLSRVLGVEDYGVCVFMFVFMFGVVWCSPGSDMVSTSWTCGMSPSSWVEWQTEGRLVFVILVQNMYMCSCVCSRLCMFLPFVGIDTL